MWALGCFGIRRKTRAIRKRSTPGGWLMGAALCGDLGQGSCPRAVHFNTDLAIMKNTKIPGWEAATLALFFQFFNVLNHYNFGIPDDSISNATFGLILYGEQSPSGILGSGFNVSMAARMIQLRAELRFSRLSAANQRREIFHQPNIVALVPLANSKMSA